MEQHDHDPLCPSNRGLPIGSSNCNCVKIWQRTNQHVSQLKAILKLLNPVTNQYGTTSGLIIQIDAEIRLQKLLDAEKGRLNEETEAYEHNRVVDASRWASDTMKRVDQTMLLSTGEQHLEIGSHMYGKFIILVEQHLSGFKYVKD